MEITKGSNVTDIKLPVPPYTSLVIADAVHGDDKFTVVIGLDEKLVRQLKAYSSDTEDTAIQNETSDLKRFGEGSYETWYAKDRTPFGLVHTETGALAALAWFGPEEFPNAPPLAHPKTWHTIAYRSYVPFRGKGFMKAFCRFCIETYGTFRPEVRLWAGIHSDNISSIKLAEALGFERVDSPAATESSQIVMVQREG